MFSLPLLNFTSWSGVMLYHIKIFTYKIYTNKCILASIDDGDVCCLLYHFILDLDKAKKIKRSKGCIISCLCFDWTELLRNM